MVKCVEEYWDRKQGVSEKSVVHLSDITIRNLLQIKIFKIHKIMIH